MQTSVYSWRLSTDLKINLEEQARREGKSVAELLLEFAEEGLRGRSNELADDQEQQRGIRERAAAAIGSIRGHDPTRSARAKQLGREIIHRNHRKGSHAARRTH